MRLDKTKKKAIIFLSTLVIIITAYMVQIVVSENSISIYYEKSLSLTGARLSDKMYVTMENNGLWTSDFGLATQLEFFVYNLGNVDLDNWVVTFKVPKESVLDDFWGCNAVLENDVLKITPLYYNLSIPSMESVEFGFILSATEKYAPITTVLGGYKSDDMVANILEAVIWFAFFVWLIAVIIAFVGKFKDKSYSRRQKNDVKIILQSMNTFINFIDAKDPYTRGHSKRVAMYAAEIAKRMRLSDDEIQNIYYAGLLHDAGKISVPDAVLNKPGKLTEEERKMIQNHTVAGGKMLIQMTSLRGVRETALYHHERYDGTGYPDGLKGEMIPLYARIVGVADSYDAMSSNRVYRRHLTKDEIIEEIQKGSGTQFDPVIVKYMIDMINDGYVNVVKMETAENDDGKSEFHIREEEVPGVFMGFQ